LVKFGILFLALCFSSQVRAQSAEWTLIPPPDFGVPLPLGTEAADMTADERWRSLMTPGLDLHLPYLPYLPYLPWEDLDFPSSQELDQYRQLFASGGAFVGGGGGEGIICFDTERQANTAFDDEGRLRQEARQHIVYTVVQDSVEGIYGKP